VIKKGLLLGLILGVWALAVMFDWFEVRAWTQSMLHLSDDTVAQLQAWGEHWQTQWDALKETSPAAPF